MAAIGDISGCVGAVTAAVLLARSIFIDGVKHALVLKNLIANDALTLANNVAIQESHRDLKAAFASHVDEKAKGMAELAMQITGLAERLQRIESGLNGPLTEKIKKSVIAEVAKMNKATLPCHPNSPTKTD